MGVCGCATRPPSSTTGADNLESSSLGSGGINCGINRSLGWRQLSAAAPAARKRLTKLWCIVELRPNKGRCRGLARCAGLSPGWHPLLRRRLCSQLYVMSSVREFRPRGGRHRGPAEFKVQSFKLAGWSPSCAGRIPNRPLLGRRRCGHLCDIVCVEFRPSGRGRRRARAGCAGLAGLAGLRGVTRAARGRAGRQRRGQRV
eukprot:scaffold35227_cov46-Phaeocystis_antarctica.AAC.7